MLLRNFFAFSFLLFSVSVSVGQRKCWSDEYHKHPKKQAELKKFEQMIQAYSAGKRTHDDDIVYTIPVVVHVVYNSNLPMGNIKSDNISDQQIFEQIRVLNEDFRRKPGTNGFNDVAVGADTKFDFCLATKDPDGNPTTGITRTKHTKTSWDPNNDDEALKSLVYWPSDQYLNIWVTNVSQNYLGYAQFPSGSGLLDLYDDLGAETDGVVIDYTAFGTEGANKPPYNLGRTTTHEVGHWLGLRHIWGDGQCETDYVEDTPPHFKPNTDITECEPHFSTCFGVTTRDMIENYMDYTGDKCMNIFTEGQTERMRACMVTAPRRKALLNSYGCCQDGEMLALPFREDFESGNLNDNNWKINNPNSGKTWEIAGAGGFGESWSSVSVSNEGVYSSADSTFVDYLETPFIGFKGSVSPSLIFNLAYAKNNAFTTDSLVLSYNLTCREDMWMNLKTFTDADLVTTDKIVSGFVPAPADWKKIKLSLGLLQNKNARFRFESYSKAKNNVYIDDINIFNAYTSIQLNLFNNAEKRLHVDMQYENEKDVEVSIFNIVGQQISSFKETNKSSHVTEINVSNLNPGIYIIVVATNNEKVPKKFLIH